jgi:hypothetical protein
MSKAIPEPITKLIQSLSRLPGIGPKTASRLAYFMLRAPDDVHGKLGRGFAKRQGKYHVLLHMLEHHFQQSMSYLCGWKSVTSARSLSLKSLWTCLPSNGREFIGDCTMCYMVLFLPVNGIGPDD